MKSKILYDTWARVLKTVSHKILFNQEESTFADLIETEQSWENISGFVFRSTPQKG